jgi:hypothetical protein
MNAVDEPQLRGKRAQQGQRTAVVRVDRDRESGDVELGGDPRQHRE